MTPDPAHGADELWLAHHWPADYDERCLQLGSRHVCRRCLALYPLGIVLAFAAALGLPFWPDRLDPALIWLLCLPATIAFVGEALGVFSYNGRWQSAMMAITATAFGKALSYELQERWSPEFWQPVAVFGGIWFAASLYQLSRRRHKPQLG